MIKNYQDTVYRLLLSRKVNYLPSICIPASIYEVSVDSVLL